MWQDCTVYNNTFETIGRLAVKYSCNGFGIEYCKKGYLYIYYDCDTYEIDEEDFTYDSFYVINKFHNEKILNS